MTKEIKIGSVTIGNGHPIAIQSMCTTKTIDAEATIKQINELTQAGCEIVRVAVPDMASCKKISEIKSHIRIPLVADIHFDYRLAIESALQGADKIRFNPGNIGSIERLKAVVHACKDKKIPIRIGVNGGSLEKDLYETYQKDRAQAMVESAKRHVALLEEENFYDIVVSLKSSSVKDSYDANVLFAKEYDYPLHLGVTEAGIFSRGSVKSASLCGALLLQHIGDTLRITLTEDPKKEVIFAKQLLQALELRHFSPEVISCPTCARTQIDLIPIVQELEEKIKQKKGYLTIAVMGCAVNGPGEAKDADIGVAAGKGSALLFKKGKKIRTIPENKIVSVLMEEAEKILSEQSTINQQ